MSLKIRQIKGCGLGFREPLAASFFSSSAASLPWVEILSDNFLAEGGVPRALLDQVVSRYPFTMHSVGLSLGGSDPINYRYLEKLRLLQREYKPAWISEHLCWTAHHGVHFHDLLPLPYTEETVRYVAARINEVQNFLSERILIENVSSYLSYTASTLSESQFLASVSAEADCDLLLDINNIFVSASNHEFDPLSYLKDIPSKRVKEIHLGGHEIQDGHLIDTHSRAVVPQVWALYKAALERFGPVPTLIEWDSDLPDFTILLDEAGRAQALMDSLSQECRTSASAQ